MGSTRVNALLLDSGDNVVVLLVRGEEEQEIHYMLKGEEQTIKIRDNIPIYHKVSIKDIKAGEMVIKYGHIIGEAKSNIPGGSHVHCHNLSSVEKKGEMNESLLGL